MATRQCPGCQEWVPQEAKACPECGALLGAELPRESAKSPPVRSSLWFGLLVCLPLLLLGGASFPVTMGLLFAGGGLLMLAAPFVAWHAHHRGHHEQHGH